MNGQTNGSSGTSSPLRIYDARSVTFPGPTLQAEDYESFRGADTAIVIDNGIYSNYLESSSLVSRLKSATGWVGY